MPGGRRIAALVTLLFLSMLSLTLPVAQLDKFMGRLVPATGLGYETTAKSLFITAYFLGFIIFALVSGALSDRMGRRKPFIMAGLFGSAAMYLLVTTVQNLPLLYFARFIDGIFSAMAVSLLMTSALDIASSNRVGATMGILTMGMMIGNAIGAPLGGLLGNISVLYPFYLGAGFLALAGLLAVFLPEPPIGVRPDSFWEAISMLFERKGLAIPYAFSLVERLTVGFFVGIFPILMSQKFAASPATIGMYQGIFLMFFAFLSPLGGILSDQIGRTRPLVIASLLYALVLYLVGQLNESALFPVMALGGVCGAIFYPATIALVGDLAPLGRRGVAIGGFNVFGSIGFAAGPILLGLVADTFSLEAASAVAGLVVFLVALSTLPYLRRLRAYQPAAISPQPLTSRSGDEVR